MKMKRILALYLIIVFVFSAFTSMIPGGIGQNVYAENLGTGTEPDSTELDGESNQVESSDEGFQSMSVTDEVYGVINPGFDDPEIEPWLVSGGWNAADSVYSICTTDPRSEPNCVRLDHERKDKNLYQKYVAVEPNTDYTFSFYAKTEIDQAIRYYVTRSNPEGDWVTKLTNYLETYSSNGEWNQYTVAFNSKEATLVIIVLSDFASSAQDSISYIDDVELRPSSSALTKAKVAASEKTETDYTEESWTVLAQALAMPEETKEEMAAKTAAINNAITGLEPEQKSDINMAANPGFDDPKTEPWLVTDGWNAADSVYSICTTDPRSEPNCVRLDHARSGKDLYQREVAVKPNTDYTFSFYAKTEIDQAIRYYVTTHPEWRPRLSDLCLTFGRSNDWNQYAVAFNSGEAKSVILVLSDYGASAQNSISYIDDVELRPSSSALSKAKAAASEKKEADYITFSWAALVEALAMPEETKEEMATKTAAINNAITGLILAQEYEPKVYYVSPYGDDEDTGTSESEAWKTLSKAGLKAMPGDNVIFLDGEYFGQLVPANSGAPGLPITFKAQNKGKVLFKGDPNLTGMQFAISIDGKSHINIDGIHVEMQSINYGRWLRIRGFENGIRAHDINITNCLMQNATGSEDTLNAYNDKSPVALSYCDNIRLTGNTIRDLRRMDDMISIKYATKIVLDGNAISKAPHVSLVVNCEPEFLYEGTHSDGNYENRIYNTNKLVIRNNVFNTQTGRRFSIFPSENVLIEGNIFSENINGGGNANGADKILANQGIYRFNRVMRNSIFPIEIAPYGEEQFAENIRIYNNIFAENANCAIFFSDSECRVNNNIIKNNIFYNNDNNAEKINMRFLRNPDDLELENDAHMKIHNNLFWHGNGVKPYFVSWDGWSANILKHSLESLQPSGKFINNINEDPLFKNAKNYNFALESGSPAIDSAEALTTALGAGTNSTELIVADARYFYDGWGISGENGDTISVGTASNTATITGVDYENNIKWLSTSLR